MPCLTENYDVAVVGRDTPAVRRRWQARTGTRDDRVYRQRGQHRFRCRATRMSAEARRGHLVRELDALGGEMGKI